MSFISKISAEENIALVTFEDVPSGINFLSDIFCKVADEKINVDMISKTANTGSAITLSFTVKDDDIANILAISKEVKKKYPGIKTMIQGDNAKIVLFGQSLPDECGVAASAFQVLNGAGIDVTMITTSDMDISVLVSGLNLQQALDALYDCFGLNADN